MDPTHRHSQHEAKSRSVRGRWVLAGFMLVGAFFLWTEHRAHLLGILPYLLLLACPLMHLFHHHGHGKHEAEAKEQADPPAPQEKQS